MSSSVVKVNGVEVETDAMKPTVININLNQPSALAALVDVTKTALKGSKFPARVSKMFSGEQKAIGAVQIVIGLICVSFAVIFCIGGDSRMYWSGNGFWTGIPYILIGAVAIVSERRAGCCWRFLALLMQLVSLGVTIGAIVVTSPELNWYLTLDWYGWSPSSLCDTQANDDYRYRYRNYYETTTPTPESNPLRVANCKNVLARLLTMFYGVKIMFFASLCLALCMSLYSLGCSIKSLCSACASQQEEEKVTVGSDTEPLLTTEPPPYAVQGPKVETV